MASLSSRIYLLISTIYNLSTLFSNDNAFDCYLNMFAYSFCPFAYSSNIAIQPLPLLTSYSSATIKLSYYLSLFLSASSSSAIMLYFYSRSLLYLSNAYLSLSYALLTASSLLFALICDYYSYFSTLDTYSTNKE
jgi:hypothetical protein